MDTLAFDAGAVTAVIGYTATLQRVLPEKWIKDSVLISVALGILYAFSIRPGKAEIGHNIVSGVMIGLGASGGYAGMKNFVENRQKAPAA